jgi:hypothetical protein
MFILLMCAINMEYVLLFELYLLLAEMPGVARDYIRNEGTGEINYGIT